MLMNKWIIVALGAATALLGYFSTVDWATLYPSKAGAIVSAIGLIKVLIGAFMPAPSQSTVSSTGNSIITHMCAAFLGLVLVAMFLLALGSGPASAHGFGPQTVGDGAWIFALAVFATIAIAMAIYRRRLGAILVALLGAVLLAACSPPPAPSPSGASTAPKPTFATLIAGDLKIASADIKAVAAALPSFCALATVGAGMTAAELDLVQSETGLPVKTVANVSNALSKGTMLCRGTAIVLSPLAK